MADTPTRIMPANDAPSGMGAFGSAKAAITGAPTIDCPFRLGDRVRVNERCEFYGDWRDAGELRVVGIRLDRGGKIDIHISADWPKDGGADGRQRR